MRAPALAAVLLAVLVAGCTSQVPDAGGDDTGPTEPLVTAPEPVDAPDGVVRVQGCEPRSLLPSDTPRSCGQQVVDALFSQLVELDPVDATPGWGLADDRAVAASIQSLDARRWVIQLEDGWTFHDGTPVTAASFVDAWNFAAYGPNGQANAYLFAPIQGFDDLHCPDPGCEPTDATLDGLRVVDDRTLEVVLARPDRGFPRRLAHPAFSPLPPRAFEDPDVFREAPVGNGPFRMEGAWEHEQRIRLRAVEDHPGGSPVVAGVDLLLFDDVAAAWAALAEGRLDVATDLPPDHRAEADAVLDREIRDGDDYEALVVPSYLPRLADDDRLARALSMAIDRRRLIRDHLDGGARPARGLVPPVVSDEVDRCGTTCRFQPEAARALLDEAGGLPPAGIELWYDRAGDQEAWVRGVAAQLRTHLRLDDGQVRVRPLSHTVWVSHVQDRRVRGLYPTGWSMDVASPDEYLRELHAPGGLFDFDRYRGADVAARMRAIARADTERDARLLRRRLERDLLADMHHVPLWVRTHRAWSTPRVGRVVLDGTGLVRLVDLVLADEG